MVLLEAESKAVQSPRTLDFLDRSHDRRHRY